jgi:hypothetical protein
MKTISTLAAIGLLFFACKVCSSGNSNRRIDVDVSPSPKNLMYARDFIKPELGPFTLVKSYDKTEARRTASGAAVKFIDQSTDTVAAEYKSSDVRGVVLMVCSYSNTATPASLVAEMERDMRRSTAWRSVNNVPRTNGTRIEGQDNKGNGLVIWNNGYWLFMTIGNSLSDTTSLANTVGY